MDIKQLKLYLKNNPDKIQLILEECGFGNIKNHRGSEDDYLTLSNIGGDNKTAITIYLNESLLTINYTHEMCQNKNSCDFLDLICFARQDKDETFFQTLKYIAETSGLTYYSDLKQDIPESLRIIKKLREMMSKIDSSEEDNTPITPKDEIILSYYYPYVNQMFADDGISYGTQVEFEIGLDPFSGRITIPIRDELGTLVGVKSRFFNREVPENELKYYYLEPCPKGKILYGYFKSKDYMKESDYILLGESEKSFLQMWSYGYKNVAATGGTKVSQHQIDKLSRLGKRLVLCFDRDFTEDKIQSLRNKFLGQIDFWAIVDRDGILGEKESPSDNKEKFEYLLKNNVYKIDRVEDNR